jgi:hypothetical protein
MFILPLRMTAVRLTKSGEGVKIPVRVEKGRLRFAVQMHQPVRLAPA